MFTRLTAVMYYGTEIKASHFGVKGSEFNVTVNEMCILIVV